MRRGWHGICDIRVATRVISKGGSLPSPDDMTPSAHTMRLSRLALAALALSSMGCLEGLDTPDGKAGFITVDLQSTSGDAYATRPLGVFYDETSLRFNPAVPGRCAELPFFDDDPDFNAGKTMNVGESVVATLPSGTGTLLPTTEFDFTFYRASDAGGIPVVPGEVISFAIPGGDGYPAAMIADATPEVFTFADVPVPLVAQDIDITWTPPTTEGSIINFSLRFADDFSEGPVNRQISCWFTDDGADQIPASFMDGWIRARDGVRYVSATRLRSKVLQVEDDVELTMISTLSVPTESITQ